MLTPSPRSRHRLLAWLLLALAGALHAQPELVMQAPPLPLRNVLIEVRQDDGESRASERLDADIAARVQPGRTEADIAIDARRREMERSGRAQQQVLVLNGRPAAIVLGNSVPVRLRQLSTQGGVRRVVPGTVWLQTGTGFTVTPLWDGGDMVHLELLATQGRQPLGHSTSTSTTLLLPLGEWVTVAESEDLQTEGRHSYGANVHGRASNRLRVQVRISRQ